MVDLDTRTRLLDTAQDLIQRRGLNAMSFADLSEAVGIRKASVHHHFASKSEMVHALLDRYLSQFGDAVDAILNARVSSKTKLRRYFALFQQTLESGQQDKGCLCGMLLAELDSLDDDGKARVRRFLDENTRCLRSILQEGADDGTFHAGPGTADLILATLEGGLLIARCQGGPKRFAATLNRMLSLLTP